MSVITPLKNWMRAASANEQKLLAELCGTSRGYLYQVAGNFRQASSELAVAIERETKTMHRASKGRLPIVYRTDLSATCRACEFAQKCLGTEVAVRGSFDPVTVADLKEGA